MSKQKSDFKNGTKQNKPYYIQEVSKKDDMVKIDENIISIVQKPIIEKPITEKFKITRLNNNVLLSIDGERPHIIYPSQLYALTLACINISKSVIPECNFDTTINDSRINPTIIKQE